MVDFLIFLFIFVVGFLLCKCSFTDLQRKTSKIYKTKWIHMWLEMNMKKGPRLDFFDFVVIVLVCIVWKIWLFPFI